MATVDWGDASSSPGTVSESGGNGSVSAAHTYTASGTYTVTITVVDDDTGSVTGTASSAVTVFDSTGSGPGFVTGGGWFESPDGAHTPNDSGDPDYGGKASFGFVARRLVTDTVAQGGDRVPTPAPAGRPPERSRARLPTPRRRMGSRPELQLPLHVLHPDSMSTGRPRCTRGRAGRRRLGLRVPGFGGRRSVDGTPDTFRIKIWKIVDRRGALRQPGRCARRRRGHDADLERFDRGPRVVGAGEPASCRLPH